MTDSTKIDNLWAVMARFGSNEIVVLLIAIVMCLALFILVTRPRLKIGSNYISFGSKKRGKRALHASCPYCIDFFHVIAKTTEIVTKICYLENITVVERQMDYVEQKIVAVKSLLMQNYAAMLIEKTKSNNVTAHDDYIVYNRLVESMLREDIKGFIKRSLINDDLLDFSETEFKVYVKEKFEYLYQIGSQFMDVWYISNKMQISREELRVSVYRLKDKFSELVFDVFGRSVSIMHELIREKSALQTELEKYCQRVVGVNSEKIQIEKGD